MRKIEKKRISIKCNATFENITDLNSNFALGAMKVAYIGQNRNISNISKEVINEAIPSMYNCPIVGRYIRDLDDFGGHDCELVTDKDSNIKLINSTTPFGVVPESASYHFEKTVDKNSAEHEYFIIDKVILWKRQEGFDCIKENKSIGQSMEVDFLEYHVDSNNYLVADKIEFSAFCLLGKDVEPCFEDANVQVFSNSKDYKKQFMLMCDELKQLSTEQLKKVEFFKKDSKKGGNQIMKLTQDKISKILTEFNIKINDLDFEITDSMTEEDFRIKLNKFNIKQSKINTFAATYQQKFDALENACDSCIERDESGEIISSTYYWVCDFDDEYVYVGKNYFTDNDCERTNGRFTYTFDESTLTATLTSEFELMIVTWLTVEENKKLEESRNVFKNIQSDFEVYKKSYSISNSEVEELKDFKKNALKEKRINDEKLLFEKFDEKLKDNVEFENLKLNTKDYSLEELEEKCFSICGKQQFGLNQTNKALINKNVHKDTDEPYGGICNGK